MNKFSISIVIPAYNCEQTIKQTILACLKQTLPALEIIIVNDGSTDHTEAIVRSFSQVKVINQRNSGPATARNRGAKETMGDIIFFTDSDCIPRDDWTASAIGHFDDPSIGVVMGTYGIANKDALLAYCIYQEIVYRHRRLPRYPKVFGSYNFAIRKKVFESSGGFDVHYRFASGEDNDLSYKVVNKGQKILFEPRSVVDHFHTTKINQYLREQFRHGYWRVKMYFDHPLMMGGDDYTFWKDILEVPIVYLIFLGIVLWFLQIKILFFPAFIFWGALLSLCFIELIYSFIVTNGFIEANFWFWITSFRAFARSFGLTSGILNKIMQKYKK